MLVFPLLVLSHLIGDFWLQTDKSARRKHFVGRFRLSELNKTRRRKARFTKHVPYFHFKISRSLASHLLHHTVVSFLLLAPYLVYHRKWLWLIVIPCVVYVFHGLIDIFKLKLNTLFCTYGGPSIWFQPWERKRNQKHHESASRSSQLFVFTIDQLLHLAILYLLTYVCDKPGAYATWRCLIDLMQGVPLHLNIPECVIATSILVVVATQVSGIVVQILAKPEPLDNTYVMDQKVTTTSTYEQGLQSRERREETTYFTAPISRVKRGAMIGYFERLIIMIAIVSGAYSAMAFIAAAKSLARFQKLDHAEWAEYFLVGTLVSIFCGTICGFLLKALLNVPT